MRTARMACRIPVCVGGLAAAASMAACSATAPQTSVTTASHASATIPSASGPVDQGALAAYTGMWSDFTTASHSSNWMYSDLAGHATSSALASMVNELYDADQQGLVSKGAPVLHPRVVHSTSTSVDISDCASTTDWLEYVKATGKLENNVPGGNRLLTAHLENESGRWSVTRYTVGALGSC